MSMISRQVAELREWSEHENLVEEDRMMADLLFKAADTIEMLSEKARGREWIPCEERLPSESGYYLVTCDGGYELSNYIQTIWFAHEDDYAGCESEWREIDDDEIVLAWMPLPEPWKGADDEQ